MQLYDKKEIEAVHRNQLYILESFADFCKKHDILYTLDYGTMLGSIRHEGFIPWDDDIDVAMLRSDYDKFLNLSKKEFNDNLFIQNYESDPGFIHAFARIRLNDSLALQEDWKHLDCHHGIFIDVFPYDTIPHEKKQRIQHQHLIYTIQEAKLYRVKMMTSKPYDTDKALIESPLSLLTLHQLNTYQTSIMTQYNNGFRNDELVTHMTQGFTSYDDYKRTVGEHSNVISSLFEHKQYPIPKAYDRILKDVYGNYLEFPPKKDQAPHHGVIKYVTL